MKGDRGAHFRYSCESWAFQGKPDCFFRSMQISWEGSGTGVLQCTGHIKPRAAGKFRVIRSEGTCKRWSDGNTVIKYPGKYWESRDAVLCSALYQKALAGSLTLVMWWGHTTAPGRQPCRQDLKFLWLGFPQWPAPGSTLPPNQLLTWSSWRLLDSPHPVCKVSSQQHPYLLSESTVTNLQFLPWLIGLEWETNH